MARKIYTLDRMVTVDLSIFSEICQDSETDHATLWSITNKHIDNIQCKPEWKPFIIFCLMWATTTSKVPKSTQLRPRRSSFQENVVIQLLAEKEPEDYEYEYNSCLIKDWKDDHVILAIEISPAFEKPSRLIDAFEYMLPYKERRLPCKKCMKAFRLRWNKTEDPYLLELTD